MKIRKFGIIAIAALALSAFVAQAQDQTIVDIAAGNEDFSTLVSLVQAAGLAETLAGEGPFTVFAPTNAAFAALPEEVVAFVAGNPEVLTSILTYHVVPGKLMAADVLAAESLTSVQGDAIEVNAGLVRVNGANIVATDIEASNGVIHVIDSVILPTIELPAADPLSQMDSIVAAGSSTVFPVTERMASLYKDEGFAGEISVDSVGTGAGFERFCVNAETDISNASRAIRDAEIEACLANEIEPLEFFIGVDALAVVVSTSNDFVTALSVEQLAAIFSGTAATWADVDPSYPAEAIQLFSPGTDSGTFDYFVEAIFDEDSTGILNAAGIQFSENDNVLVQGVEASPYAIGYFGFAYYLPNADRLRAVAVDGIEPNAATAESGEYPLSRPLYIYSSAAIMQAKPQVADFINFYLTNVSSQLGTEAGQIGYFGANRDAINLDKVEWLIATAGN